MSVQIRTLRDLEVAIEAKRAVVCPKKIAFRKPTSAAFILRLPGNVILRLLKSGMFRYEKKGEGDGNGSSE